MKIESVFTAKNNQLIKISDNSPVDASSLKQVEVAWSQVELSEENYNEEFLAQLREDLKKLEIQGVYAVIVPKADKPLDSQEQTEYFINAFNHCARRIKDCTSVAGFELPGELTKDGFGENSAAASFMETLSVKHQQYVYFTKANSDVPESIVKY